MLGGLGEKVGGVGGGMNEQMIRGLIMQALKDLKYPLGKQELTEEARKRNAPGQLTDLLARMPDRQYTSPEDVAQEAEKAR